MSLDQKDSHTKLKDELYESKVYERSPRSVGKKKKRTTKVATPQNIQ